jgi:hypothetical protein
MRRPFAIATIALAAGSLAAAGLTSAASARPLNGEEIRAAVEGKRIYLAVPLGGEFPMNYRPGGKVDATGEAVGLGRFARPTDSGRWWIDGNRLCQKWTTWYDGKPFCFVLSAAGEGRLAWVRDDGLKGVARVAR